MKGEGILIKMIYGIFIMPFIEKNSISRVHPENCCVCTNLNRVDQYCYLYRITRVILKDDLIFNKLVALATSFLKMVHT